MKPFDPYESERMETTMAVTAAKNICSVGSTERSPHFPLGGGLTILCFYGTALGLKRQADYLTLSIGSERLDSIPTIALIL